MNPLPTPVQWLLILAAPALLFWYGVRIRACVRAWYYRDLLDRRRTLEFQTAVLGRLKPPELDEASVRGWAAARGFAVGTPGDFVAHLNKHGWAVVEAEQLERLRKAAPGATLTVQEWIDRKD